MRQLSLRLSLPLFWGLALLLAGALSLTYSLHKRQSQLTEDARISLLGDVGRLTRLAGQGWSSASNLVASDVAQVATRPQVEAVMLLNETGMVLMAHRSTWMGRHVSEVWPQLTRGRIEHAAQSRLPDWQLGADGDHMDALQVFELPPSADDAELSRKGVVYVAYNLTFSRELARHAEVMGRMPDMLALLLLIGGLTWALGRYVAKPLARLDDAATALRSGKQVEIPKVGVQEIDHLGAAFEALRQELAATWRAMPDLLFELDSHGHYLRVLACRPGVFVTDPETLIGQSVLSVMPVDAAQTVLQALAEASKTGVVWGREIMLDAQAGRLWFEVSIARKDVPQHGQPTFVMVSRDITERKMADERLRQLNEELEQRVTDRTAELLAAKNEAERANQSKSDFLSRMSHELRTPLNAILGFGQLLELSMHDPQLIGHVRQIMNGGKHLLALINEVLDLARVESGQMSVIRERVAVCDILKECMNLVRPQAEAQGVRLVEPFCPADSDVMGDRVRLKQVVLNLLSNAIKYNRKEGGEVRVACEVKDQSFEIRIQDTGEGLTPEQQARLFVPFERLGADERLIEGTGIGLALSKRLMHLMGGDIGADSQVGVGSTFWIRLTRARDKTAAPSAPLLADAKASLPGKAAREGGRTVLCIEDNPNNLRLMDSVLSLLPDVRMLSAIAPGLGLELARTHQPDLILLDINLPDMDGYAVMQRLREHASTRAIPVVAVSANAMPQDLERGRAAGFAAYVTKPIDVGRLLSVVDEFTAR